jgi:hypothetical protein
MNKKLSATLLLFSIGLCTLAQNPAEMSSNDKKSIRLMARNMVASNLRGLLNTISFDDVSDVARKEIMENSYLPHSKNVSNTNQVFYDDGAIIEDDITPANTVSGKGSDMPVAKYLNNLVGFYGKSDRETIFFSDVVVSPDISMGNYPYLKVYFKSEFKGEYDPNQKSVAKYQPVWRVAELRVEKEDARWKVYITHIGFYDGKLPEPEKEDKELRDYYQKKIEELLTQAEVTLNTTNDKATAANIFDIASFYKDSFKIDNPKFDILHKEYMAKGDLIFDAELFDIAKGWYELAQSVKNTTEVRDKIKACKK